MGPKDDDDLARLAKTLGVTLDDERRERVAEEQLRMVLLHTRAGTLVATVFALMMAWHLSPGPGPAALYTWMAAKLAVGLTRVALWQARQRVVLPADKPRWRHITYALLAADGAVLGTAGYWAMGQPEATASLVAAVLACMACVATFGLQVHRLATMAYVAPMLLPTALSLLLRGDDFGWVGGVGLLLLLALMQITARGAQRRLAANELLKLHAQSLAMQKDEALSLATRQSAAKTQFIAKVSHELRTPLHGILGLARLMQQPAPADPTMASRVALIESSGTHLLGLINDLLDVARMGSDRFRLTSKPFDLLAELTEVLRLYEARAADKGLVLRLESALPAPAWVDGDAARVRQVLHNLLGNAIKFTPTGSVALSVQRPGGQDLVHFAVSDSGVGIEPQDQLRIFQPFAQMPDDSGGPIEGVGLGLTIAREIAQGMGGDITVQSQRGLGSTFAFTARLPVCMAPAAAQAVAPSPAPAAAPEPTMRAAPAPAARLSEPPPPRAAPGLPRHVLVAEDDDVNAMIVMAFLNALGVQAHRVVNGVQAVDAALQPQRPELVLMDCRMPEMDGLQATRRIRQQEAALALPHLPVIALTATSTDMDRATCLAAGMDDFVAKPFTRDELAQAMARQLALRPHAAVASAAARAG